MYKKANISSFQSMGTVDGPGIRYVVFMQGCPMRCIYCHNPETWDIGENMTYTSKEILDIILNYREYFGEKGGVTFSGGEPLLQYEFLEEILTMCREEGVHTAVDTSGNIPLTQCKRVIDLVDMIILDIKANNNEEYRELCGGSFDMAMDILNYCEETGKRVWIRRVVLPGLNDSEEDIHFFGNMLKGYKCIEKVELLPFRKICKEKYESMNLTFKADIYEEGDSEKIAALEERLEKIRKKGMEW